MPSRRVNINGDVLSWAMREAPVSPRVLAERLGVAEGEVSAWVAGRSKPTKGQFTKLVEALHRPSSIFFRSEPPMSTGLPPQLRRAKGRGSRELAPEEARLVRRARRLQRLLSWLLQQRDADPTVTYPEVAPTIDPDVAGRAIRTWLDVPVQEQTAWQTPKAAFDGWRVELENRNIVVLQLQLGGTLRGFSLWDAFVPVIAVNTGENYQARTFTAFHELAHLVSRTESACLGFTNERSDQDIEQWCEQVASAALIPRDALQSTAENLLRQRPSQAAVELISAVAAAFGVSLRAAAVAMIRLGLADSDSYAEIEENFPVYDREKGFARGGGQRAPQRRLGELGGKATSIVLDALQEDLLTERDVRDYLRLDGEEIPELASAVRP